MSRKVYKYNLGEVAMNPDIADYSLLVPFKSTILSVGLQGRDIIMWVEQNEPHKDTKFITRHIRRFWTGCSMGVREAGYNLDYYGTVQDHESGLVTHIYEEVEP